MNENTSDFEEIIECPSEMPSRWGPLESGGKKLL